MARALGVAPLTVYDSAFYGLILPVVLVFVNVNVNDYEYVPVHEHDLGCGKRPLYGSL